MRRDLWSGLAALLAAMAGPVVACSSSGDVGAIDEGATSGNSGVGPSGTTGPGYSSAYAATGTTGSSGAGGGGIGSTSGVGSGGPPDEPPPDPGGADAGPDAPPPFTCDGLDQDKPVVLYLSADDSNSMGSPALARELINAGQAPKLVRTYEFLNYYRIGYTAAPAGTLSLVPQLEAGAAPGEFDMQIGVRSPDAELPRRPMTITFVLDTSGSMAGEPIARERAAVKAIANSLSAGDVVSMVGWSSGNNVLLDGHVVTGPNDPVVIGEANALETDGGTDLHNGLVAGYALAKENYGANRLNRVVLISDAMANIGVTDEDLIALSSEDADQEGIYLLGVGTGPAEGFNDALMDVVTDKGRGAYVYLDSAAEATKMFVDRFDETMEIAARGVQIEMTMPWYFQMHAFFGEEYSENPEEIEPQHLAPSDAMVFNQVIKACDPAVVVGSDTIQIKAKWQVPLTYALEETTVTLSVDELLGGGKAQLRKGKAIVAYAEALKIGTHEALQAALDTVQAANPSQTDAELNEIGALLQKHPGY